MNDSGLTGAVKAVLPLLDSLSTAVVVLDAAGKIAAANRSAREAFGGSGLPTLRSHPALREAITRREPATVVLTHASRHAQNQVRIVPVGPLLLVESRDTSASWVLEQKLQATEKAGEAVEFNRTDLLRAYELAIGKLEEAQRQVDEHQKTIEQLFVENTRLLADKNK